MPYVLKTYNLDIGRQFCALTPTPVPQLGIVNRDQNLVPSGTLSYVCRFHIALKVREKRHVEILDGSIHPQCLTGCFVATSPVAGRGRVGELANGRYGETGAAATGRVPSLVVLTKGRSPEFQCRRVSEVTGGP